MNANGTGNCAHGRLVGKVNDGNYNNVATPKADNAQSEAARSDAAWHDEQSAQSQEGQSAHKHNDTHRWQHMDETYGERNKVIRIAVTTSSIGSTNE